MRMIDADTLKDVVHKHSYFVSDALNSFDRGMFTVGIDQAIDEMPTVDAVPVVRCRECKYHSVMPYGWECDVINSIVSEDFFCAKGERKEKTDER